MPHTAHIRSQSQALFHAAPSPLALWPTFLELVLFVKTCPPSSRTGTGHAKKPGVASTEGWGSGMSCRSSMSSADTRVPAGRLPEARGISSSALADLRVHACVPACEQLCEHVQAWVWVLGPRRRDASKGGLQAGMQEGGLERVAPTHPCCGITHMTCALHHHTSPHTPGAQQPAADLVARAHGPPVVGSRVHTLNAAHRAPVATRVREVAG